jgi:hypothetical protein
LLLLAAPELVCCLLLLQPLLQPLLLPHELWL